jgi:hypothetical protein
LDSSLAVKAVWFLDCHPSIVIQSDPAALRIELDYYIIEIGLGGKMARNFGYWVDLAGIQFDDVAGGSWIQAFPEGTYQHPVYGEMVFNETKLTAFADSVARGVRGTEIDIDYEHKAYSGEAAGWVKGARHVPGQGLQIQVEWTPKARAAIANKEYKYFSPEFTEEWVHPKTQKVHTDVLLGGGLTNRPFLKDILPVNLSDLFTEPTNPKSEPGGLMDPKALRLALGLAEDATEEQVNAKLAELRGIQALLSVQPPTVIPPTVVPPVVEPPKLTDPPKSIEQLLSELGQVGNNPAVTMLGDIIKAQNAKLQVLEDQNREQVIDRMLNDLDSGKKFAVPPAVKEQLREVMQKSPKELGDQVYDLYKQQLNLGLIDLTEHGWQRKGENLSPEQALNVEVTKLMEADKNLTYSDAYRHIATSRPELAQAVRQASYIKDGV